MGVGVTNERVRPDNFIIGSDNASCLLILIEFIFMQARAANDLSQQILYLAPTMRHFIDS